MSVLPDDVPVVPRHRLIDLAALEQLVPVRVVVAGTGVAVVRVRDDVFAFAPTCTHRPGPLTDGAVTWKGRVLCPWHLGTFDLRTGRPVSGPPESDLPVYPVEIEDGAVWLLADPVAPALTTVTDH